MAFSIVEAGVKQAVATEKRMGASLLRLHFHDCFVNLGGPTWTVLLGRRDSTTASFSAANNDIPPPTSNLSGLISSFQAHGLSTKDMVALSGMLLLILQVPILLVKRGALLSKLASTTKEGCPSVGGDNNLSPLDVATPTIFDSDYYSNLRSQKGLLHSDQQLFNGGSTDSQVTTYSTDQNTFFTDFAAAMVNMGNISPLTGISGEIRKNCRKSN
eukprot:PITA_25729